MLFVISQDLQNQLKFTTYLFSLDFFVVVVLISLCVAFLL